MLPTSRQDARASGSSRFLSGKPCKNGHVSERYTSNSVCVQCMIEHNKNATHVYGPRKEDPEKKKIRSAVWYQSSREKQILNARKWKLENPDRAKELNRLSRAKNKETSNSSTRTYRAKKRSSEGKHTKADIERIYQVQKKRCAICKTSIEKRYHVDHIVPIKKGGSNGPRNLQLLCPSCNVRKSAKDPIDHMQSLGFLI